MCKYQILIIPETKEKFWKDKLKFVLHCFSQIIHVQYQTIVELMFMKDTFYMTGIDGNWTSWSSWTPCSVTCGTGIETRTRNCSNPTPENGGQACSGQGIDTRQCNNTACTGAFY